MKRCVHTIVSILSLISLALGETAANEFEVVVYGATPGGIAASVMAAREGAEVVLIEPTRHVGGMSTSGLTTAETEHMLKWTLGGFADEFYRRMGTYYGIKDDGPAYQFESGVAERTYLALLSEAGVEVRYGMVLADVAKEDGSIRRIVMADGSEISGKVFIDASYEGDLMAKAGVAYALGRESRAEFDEDLAGIRFDKVTTKAPTLDAEGNLLPGITGWKKDYKEWDAHHGVMNCNFRLIVTRDPEHRVPFPLPEKYDPSRYQLLAHWLRARAKEGNVPRLGEIIDLYGRHNGKLEMNNRQAAIISLGHFGGQFGWADADHDGRRMILEDHLDYTLGLLHFLGSDEAVPESVRAETAKLGLHSGEFADNGHLPYQLYIRESRRMRGRFVMRQQDVQTDRRKPDSIGMGSHFIDCHHIQRLAVTADEFINEGRIWRKGSAYQIPYRSITPKREECRNLLVPCAASFTHVAYCTLRVEGTWMVTGHAAGIAAAMAATSGAAVQEIPVSALQEKLKGGRQVIDFIPGKPETCEQLNGPEEF